MGNCAAFVLDLTRSSWLNKGPSKLVSPIPGDGGGVNLSKSVAVLFSQLQLGKLLGYAWLLIFLQFQSSIT